MGSPPESMIFPWQEQCYSTTGEAALKHAFTAQYSNWMTEEISVPLAAGAQPDQVQATSIIITQSLPLS